ncbi:hypothetical protein BLOT_012915 [Blomia tropicalis]|nr:hypothetical protein BLOT_012915 [Blomia tropicalis]
MPVTLARYTPISITINDGKINDRTMVNDDHKVDLNASLIITSINVLTIANIKAWFWVRKVLKLVE